MIVFSNTTPLIALSGIGQLDLLLRLFTQIHLDRSTLWRGNAAIDAPASRHKSGRWSGQCCIPTPERGIDIKDTPNP